MFARSALRHARLATRRPPHRLQRQSSTWTSVPTLTKALAVGLIVCASAGLATGLYTFYSVAPSPYPEEVNKHLRRALYYEGAGSDPKQAVRCYLDALETATGMNLDQTSDMMTGLKIKIGQVYESCKRPDSALRIYSGLLNELQSAVRSASSDEDRLRLLRRALGVAIKVGDIAMENEAVDKAEMAYVWALETMLKESKRRGDDTTWLEVEATGGIHEAVAGFYYHTDRPQLALPLYLKAVECSSRDGPTCHTATLMNNVASSMYSQRSSDERIRRNAIEWASRARDVKVTPVSPEDKDECEFARASALVNLGMMTGDREYYTEARARARRLSPDAARELEQELQGR